MPVAPARGKRASRIQVEERLVSVRRDRLDGAGRVLPLRRSGRRTGAAPSSRSATPRSVVHAGGSLGAADAERRRLGRDLHDGAQQRLVDVVIALQMRAGCVGTRCVGPGAGRRTRAAIEDLRELGAGLRPSILTKSRGLRGAVTALTGSRPAAGHVRRPRRPARSVDRGCVLLLRRRPRRLTNVAEHAEAAEAHVEYRRRRPRHGVVITETTRRRRLPCFEGGGVADTGRRVRRHARGTGRTPGEGTAVRARGSPCPGSRAAGVGDGPGAAPVLRSARARAVRLV